MIVLPVTSKQNMSTFRIVLSSPTYSALVPPDDDPDPLEIKDQQTDENSNSDGRYPGFATSTSGDDVPSLPPLRSKFVDLNADSQLPIPARNGSLLHAFASAPSLAKNKSKVESSSPALTPPRDKENDITSQLPQPKTPIQPFGFRTRYLRDKPSPVSSSELSPLGEQIMSNLRQERMQARQKERQTGRWESTHSRIRY